jgi:tetratricopeptide (TPR) repeat protein
VLAEHQELLASDPDSSVWKTESERRNINILFFPLARVVGVGDSAPDLLSLCQSELWRPVYMDEVSIVLLRNRPENRPWIDRYQVDCRTHSFVPPSGAARMELFNFYANTGTLLCFLGRYEEAWQALARGEAIFPGDPSIHMALAQLYEKHDRPGEAEREYKTVLSLRPDAPELWHALGRFYALRARYAEARQYISTAAQLSFTAWGEYSLLGQIDLALRQPQQALEDFTKAEHASPLWHGREDLNRNFFGQVAEGRAAAYRQLGEWQRAIAFGEEATRRTPESARRWEELADTYQAAGRNQLAEQARQQARALPKE